MVRLFRRPGRPRKHWTDTSLDLCWSKTHNTPFINSVNQQNQLFVEARAQNVLDYPPLKGGRHSAISDSSLPRLSPKFLMKFFVCSFTQWGCQGKYFPRRRFLFSPPKPMSPTPYPFVFRVPWQWCTSLTRVPGGCGGTVRVFALT